MTKAHQKKDHSTSSGASSGNTGNVNHHFLDQFLRHKYVCLALLDPDFNFIEVNDAYAHAHGKPKDFFPGNSHLDLYPSDAQQIFENVRESKKPSTIIAHPVVPASQAERDTTYWDWTIEPILSQKNEVEALLLTETEVTRRVHTEQAFYKSSKILIAIERALERHNPHTEPGDILATLLADVIDLTESEYGFIGNVLRNADRQHYLKIGTILNFSQSNEAPALRVTQEPRHLDLTDPDTLPGKIIGTGEAVIVNDPANEPGCAGLPEGHPVLSAFIGIPLKDGETLVGMIGLANCADGYDKSLLEFLQPLLKCYLQLINSNVAYWEKHEALTSLAESERLNRDLAVPVAENEHDNLIALINKCYEEMQEDVDAATIEQLLNKTYSAIANHFLNQERFMESAAYPAFGVHKKSHDTFLSTFRTNIDHFVAGSDHDVHILQNMLVNWFGRHWSTFDLRMNSYFSRS